MKTLLVTLNPLTAFATPPYGDTLFGQLCWALRNRHGEDWLSERLQGYTQGKPFLVVADLFPSGYWPRPHLPPGLFPSQTENEEDRKAERKRVWLPRQEWKDPLAAWIQKGKAEKEIWSKDRRNRPQSHNTINRLTGATGDGIDGFAPYSVEQTWFPPEALLDLWLVHDPDRLTREQLETVLQDVGLAGFGKDASTGLGKFAVKEIVEDSLPCQEESNAWLTLGFCAPQGCGFDSDRSYYQVFTRFGRHGDVAALSGHVFKSPILLARAGAVLTPKDAFQKVSFVGQGLGGDGSLSKAIRETVHQGYAPVVGIRADWKGNNHG
ncbi:CRISPR-associated protein Csm4 [Gammaproteobacteria bacterium]